MILAAALGQAIEESAQMRGGVVTSKARGKRGDLRRGGSGKVTIDHVGSTMPRHGFADKGDAESCGNEGDGGLNLVGTIADWLRKVHIASFAHVC
jgi:hypothetical protein